MEHCVANLFRRKSLTLFKTMARMAAKLPTAPPARCRPAVRDQAWQLDGAGRSWSGDTCRAGRRAGRAGATRIAGPRRRPDGQACNLEQSVGLQRWRALAAAAPFFRRCGEGWGLAHDGGQEGGDVADGDAGGARHLVPETEHIRIMIDTDSVIRARLGMSHEQIILTVRQIMITVR